MPDGISPSRGRGTGSCRFLSAGGIDEAVALSLRLARKAGKQIRKGHPEKAEGLAASFDCETALKKEKGRAEGACPLSAETVTGELLGLLILRDSWRARLEKAALPEAKIRPLDPEYERKVLVQLAFRYLLKAAYDGRLHARMKFIAFRSWRCGFWAGGWTMRAF